MMKPVLLAALVTAGSVIVRSAHAQEASFAGAVDAKSGIEGGGSGHAAGVRRARTTLEIGAEAWIDESPADHLAVGAVVELEPRASVGAALRYLRLLGEMFSCQVGAIGIIAPKYMIGLTAGMAFRPHLGERVSLSLGPSINAYVLGSDLPEDRVLWQAVLAAGARVMF